MEVWKRSDVQMLKDTLFGIESKKTSREATKIPLLGSNNQKEHGQQYGNGNGSQIGGILKDGRVESFFVL